MDRADAPFARLLRRAPFGVLLAVLALALGSAACGRLPPLEIATPVAGDRQEESSAPSATGGDAQGESRESLAAGGDAQGESRESLATRAAAQGESRAAPPGESAVPLSGSAARRDESAAPYAERAASPGESVVPLAASDARRAGARASGSQSAPAARVAAEGERGERAAQKPVLISSKGAVLAPARVAEGVPARALQTADGVRPDIAAAIKALRRTETVVSERRGASSAAPASAASSALSAPAASAPASSSLASAAPSAGSAPPARGSSASAVPASSATSAPSAPASAPRVPLSALSSAPPASASLPESPSRPAAAPPALTPPAPFAPVAQAGSAPRAPSDPAWLASREEDGFGARFTVRTGLLSDNVRTLVRGFDWQLKWPGETDRRIEAPFTIPRDTLKATLRRLLELYEGQFVADLYQANRMVVVAPAPPGVEIREAGEPPRAPQPEAPARGELEAPREKKKPGWLRFPEPE